MYVNAYDCIIWEYERKNTWIYYENLWVYEYIMRNVWIYYENAWIYDENKWISMFKKVLLYMQIYVCTWI